MADKAEVLRGLAWCLVAELNREHMEDTPPGRLGAALGVGPDDDDDAVATVIAEALGLKACRCAINGPGEVIPPACPVHGTPCEQCSGVEGCTEDCGTAPGDPAGTVTDLRTGGPRTVTRDGDCLVIPGLRLDAEGCALLRTIINGEMPGLAARAPAPAALPLCEKDGEITDTYGAEHYWQCGHPGAVTVPSGRLLCEDHAGELGYGPKQEEYGFDPDDGFTAAPGQVAP